MPYWSQFLKLTPMSISVPKDLLSEEIEADDSEKDDMTILNEILNAPSASGEDDFSREWQAVFGHTPLAAGGVTLTPGETDQSQQSAEFMPSNLLDVDLQMASLNISEGEFCPGLCECLISFKVI